MLALLAVMLLSWFFLPKVTVKDAKAYAEALFLEQCRVRHLNPSQYLKPPQFSVEGGNEDLIFVFRYQSSNLPTMTIKIDKMGKTAISYQTIGTKTLVPSVYPKVTKQPN